MKLFDFKVNLTLTIPILLTRLLGIASNFIVMLFLARLGTAALSASAIIMSVFSISVVLVLAFTFSLPSVFAQATMTQLPLYPYIQHAWLLITLVGLPFALGYWYIDTFLLFLQQNSWVVKLVKDYFHVFLIGYFPLLWSAVLEQLYVGCNKAMYIVYLSLFNLILNTLCSHWLIFGGLGVMPLGMQGAGLAVSIAAWMNFIILLLLEKRLLTHAFNYQRQVMRQIIRLGFPLFIQYGGELLAYASMTIMMGWLSITALAAQQILIQLTAIIMMFPMSVGQATAILVSKATYQDEQTNIIKVSLIIICCCMFVIGLGFVLCPNQLTQLYLNASSHSQDDINKLLHLLLCLAAVTQLFDGMRQVIAGAYRGVNNTQLPALVNILALWLVSIPCAYGFAFLLHLGAVGIRVGYAIGVIIAALYLLWGWCQITSSNAQCLARVARQC